MTVDVKVYKSILDIVKAGWTQGRYAAAKDNVTCNPLSMEACKWCSTGAIMSVIGYDPSLGGSYDYGTAKLTDVLHDHVKFLEEFDPRLDGCLWKWNDHEDRTQEDVIQLFTEVIKYLERKE